VALCLRLMSQPMPLTDVCWGPWIWMLGVVAGFLCHSPQASLADYYRQIHLYFIKGKAGSELDSYANQHAIYESLPKSGRWMERIFYYNYQNYCKSQERRTPMFQRFYANMLARWGAVENTPQQLRDDFRRGSKPLMPLTNILTFNTRAIALYLTCLLDMPWAYMLFEIVVLTIIYIYMHKKHETLCAALDEKLSQYGS